MPKYEISVEIQYDDSVTVEADSREEAEEKAIDKACDNVGVYATISANVRNVEEIS